MTFEIVPFDAAWDGLRDRWLAVFEACENPCVWYHPLLLTSTGALPPDLRPSHLATGYENDTLVFGVPGWVRTVRPRVRRFEFYSGAGFDHLAPLDATPDGSASSAFYRSLGPRHGIHVLLVRNMDETAVACLEEATRAAAPVFKRHAFRCPTMRLPDRAEALPSAVRKSIRKGIRRRLRRAAESGVGFRVVPYPATERSCTDAIETLFSLHEERSAAIGRDSTFSVSPWREFHEEVCRNADRYPGLVRFHEAVLEDRVLATIYGFVAGGVFHDFQGGMSAELPELSLGNLVRYSAMESLIGDGIALFDFLRGTEDYKWEWTSEWRHDSFVLAGSPGRGRVGVGWARLERAVHREGRARGAWHWLRGRD